MTGKLGKFYVDCGVHGARVMTTSLTLTPNCIAEEIDTNIELLKADLDACADEMKRQLRAQRATPMFDKSVLNSGRSETGARR
jgi:hypothetical protein